MLIKFAVAAMLTTTALVAVAQPFEGEVKQHTGANRPYYWSPRTAPVQPPHNFGANYHFHGASTRKPFDANGLTSDGPVTVDEPAAGIQAASLFRSWDANQFVDYFPADCNLAVGPNHVIGTTNRTMIIYDKNGNQLSSQQMSAVFNEAPGRYFDPKSFYDPWQGRYVVISLATPTQTDRSQSWFAILISATNDPMGVWYKWYANARLDGNTDVNQWADYPSYGFDPDGLYLSAVMKHPVTRALITAKVRIFKKADLYNGIWSGWMDMINFVTDGQTDEVVQPAQMQSYNGIMYLVNRMGTRNNPTDNRLVVRRVTNVLNWPTFPTIVREIVTVASYSLPPNARQSSGAPSLFTVDGHLMDKASYFNGRLYTGHTVALDWGDGQGARCVLRLYQLRFVAGTTTVERQINLGLAGYDYIFPSIQVTQDEDAIIGFGRVSDVNGEFIGLRHVGWKKDDPIQGSAQARAGAGVENVGFWGDYFGSQLDPWDRRTVWIIGSFGRAANNWQTHIAELNFKPNTSLSVPNVSGAIGETVQLRATLRRTDIDAPLEGKTVAFMVDNSLVGFAVTNASGVAARNFTISPEFGVDNHPILAIFAPDTQYNGSQGGATLNARKASVTVFSNNVEGRRGEEVTLAASLVRQTNGQALSGETIRFYVNNQLVGPATTNFLGIATLPYVIPQAMALGNHEIRAEFAGDENHLPGFDTSTLNVYRIKIIGTITMGGIPDPDGLPIRFVVSDSAAREPHDVLLGENGRYEFETDQPGGDATISAALVGGTWLRIRRAVILRGEVQVDFELPNGDADRNGTIDDADLAIVLTHFGVRGPGDLNGDGNIDDTDLALVLASFGRSSDPE
ncbi:MAG: Ig-like domain repeat protein [Armatimonadetes bacterium]|nr:Ig-like domain repeat protein [Armatimonadota bacterium]